MYFASAVINGEETVIVSTDKSKAYKVNDFLSVCKINPVCNMKEFINMQNDTIIEKIKSMINTGYVEEIDVKQLTLTAAIPKPLRNVFCVGKNYKDHINEMNKAFGSYDLPKKPMYFTKASLSATGPNQKVSVYSEMSQKADYEAELIIIMGKQTHKLNGKNAEDYIFGYACGNDLSLRDIQNERGQVFYGKSFDGLFAMGAWIAHKSIIKYPVELNIRSYVNDSLRQNGNTGDMIFDPHYIVNDLSCAITLMPADMIMTGSPAGSACNHANGFLTSGDRLKTYIENIDEFTIIIE